MDWTLTMGSHLGGIASEDTSIQSIFHSNFKIGKTQNDSCYCLNRECFPLQRFSGRESRLSRLPRYPFGVRFPINSQVIALQKEIS